MIVVSNTSPINYLVLIEQIDLLPRLFQQIIIPQAVCDELLASDAPQAVRAWISNPPDWLKTQTVSFPSDPVVDLLDRGEREAILLAQAVKADLLLLDDMKARRTAIDRGLRITGILGILDQATAMKLINLPDAITGLRNTSFWVSDGLLQTLLDRHS